METPDPPSDTGPPNGWWQLDTLADIPRSLRVLINTLSLGCRVFPSNLHHGEILTLDIQNHPVLPGEDRCLEPPKAEPEEMFRGSNTSSKGVWMHRVRKF